MANEKNACIILKEFLPSHLAFFATPQENNEDWQLE